MDENLDFSQRNNGSFALEHLENDRHSIDEYQTLPEITPALINALETNLLNPDSQVDSLEFLNNIVCSNYYDLQKFPNKFFQTFIYVFGLGKTNVCFKTKMLHFLKNAFEKSPALVDRFANLYFYTKVFDEINKGSQFSSGFCRIEDCLLVLNFFFYNHPMAINYLIIHRFIDILYKYVNDSNQTNDVQLEAIYKSFDAILSSKFYKPDQDFCSILTNKCIQEIINYDSQKSHDGNCLVPMISAFSKILKYSNESYFQDMFNNSIALKILSMITTDNYELSSSAAVFLQGLTCYDITEQNCFQLIAANAIPYLFGLLENVHFIFKCAPSALDIIFNLLVTISKNNSMHNYFSDLVNNYPFINSSNILISNGNIHTIEELFSVLSILITFLPSNETIYLIQNLVDGFYDYIQTMIERGNKGAFIILERLINLINGCPEFEKDLHEFREMILSEEIVESIQHYLSICSSDHITAEYANKLLQWIEKESNQHC